MSDKFTRKLTDLVRVCGGTVEEDLFVTAPGCALAWTVAPTAAGEEVFRAMNIDPHRPSYEQIGEFNARLTYLAFNDAPKDATKYNHKISRELGHLSVHGQTVATMLVAGISIETSLELISHPWGRVGRLTSSSTGAMTDTLYRIQGGPEERERQRAFIRKFLDLRNSEATGDKGRRPVEWWNMLNLGCKATALTVGMSLREWDWVLSGRLPEAGNEAEVREIARLIATSLNTHYPLAIRTPQEYGYTSEEGSAS